MLIDLNRAQEVGGGGGGGADKYTTEKRRKTRTCRWDRQRKGKKKRRGKKKKDGRSVLRTPALLNEVVPRCLRSRLPPAST